MLHFKACARTFRQKAADIALMVFGLIAAAYTTVQTIRVCPTCTLSPQLMLTIHAVDDGPAARRPTDLRAVRQCSCWRLGHGILEVPCCLPLCRSCALVLLQGRITSWTIIIYAPCFQYNIHTYKLLTAIMMLVRCILLHVSSTDRRVFDSRRGFEEGMTIVLRRSTASAARRAKIQHLPPRGEE